MNTSPASAGRSDADEPAGHISSAGRFTSLYGPLLLALYFLMTSRWGSYLLPGPPYLGDLALGALIVQRIWSLTRRGGPQPVISRVVACPAALLLLFAFIWLISGGISIVALRDVAPYFYAVLIFFGQRYRETSEVLTQRLVYAALLLHAAWFTLSELVPAATGLTTPGSSESVFFELRSDVDGAIVGITVALAIDRTIRGRTPIPSAIVAAWGLSLILAVQSRASLIASVAMLLLITLRQVVIWRRRASKRKVADGPRIKRRYGSISNAVLAVAVVVAVPLVITLVSGAPAALSRSLDTGLAATTGTSAPSSAATTGTSEPSSAALTGKPGNSGGNASDQPDPVETNPVTGLPVDTGVATASARLAGWRAVIDWIDDGGVKRFTLGVGFGPHYLQMSGADIAFLGPAPDPSVRAVHNFGLNTWARLGLAGLLLVVSIVVLSLVAGIRLITRTADPPDLDLLATLIVLAIPITAFLGVVLESPFGAIPYFWAVGYLSARMVEEGLWRPLKVPPRLRKSTV